MEAMLKQVDKQNGEHLTKTSRHDPLSAASTGILVAAIDLGTTYSGWAFSFLHDLKENPPRVTVKQWISGSGTLVTEKAPTCVLIKPDGETLEAFGYDAENRYKELLDTDDHKRYYYFRRFKMLLNKRLGEEPNEHVEIEDTMGKPLSALMVFSTTIRFLVNDMVGEAEKRLSGDISEKDVKTWVLTVPAIWTDPAKKFMRDAAIKAGIASEKLVLALEPEAASILCRYLSVDKTVDGQDVSIATFKAGTKYMILDAGGGTIDITVHEVTLSGGLREVYAASGGGWGGILVDEAFENLLIDIVGTKAYERFKKEETEDWIDFWRDFEVKKKTISPEKNARISMRFPLSLGEIFKKTNKKKIAKAIASSKYSDEIEFQVDKIKYNASLMKGIFGNSVAKTVEHVKTMIRKEQVKDLKAILMVGGFSDSPMLQHAIKECLPDKRIIVPPDAASAILKGAVIFGHRPDTIMERVAKYTYGIRAELPFEEGVDPESRKIVTDNGIRCKDCFCKHVELGQSVDTITPTNKQSYSPSYRHQKSVLFQIYASELKNPMYVDQNCTEVGEFEVMLSDHDGNLERTVCVTFNFGGTMIEVKSEDEQSGENATAVFNS